MVDKGLIHSTNSGSNFEPHQLSEESHNFFLSQASNINPTINHPTSIQPSSNTFLQKVPRFHPKHVAFSAKSKETLKNCRGFWG